MSFFCPLSIDMSNRDCLVIGGGRVAMRKVNFLLDHNGKVTVVSPVLNSNLKEYLTEGEITYIADIYRPVYLADRFLVICATNDPLVNHTAAQDCHSKGILVNTVNEQENCTFLIPAQFKRGLLGIAVSTSGASPALARRIRDNLKEQFGPEYIQYSHFLFNTRPSIMARVKDNKQRRIILEYLADGSFFKEFLNMTEMEAKLFTEELITSGGSLSNTGECGVNKCKR